MPITRSASVILTQCPSCRTLFDIADGALEACGGAVRCGQCGAVFQADLYRIPEATTGPEPAVLKKGPPRRWPRITLLSLLGILAIIQALYVSRNLLDRVALSRPLIHAVCQAPMPCHLSHPAAVNSYRLLQPTVRLGAHSGLLRIRAELLNKAGFRQTLPLLSVTLLDASHRPIARSNYREQTFLRRPRPTLRSQQKARIQLNLQVPPTAVGYRLALFPTSP